jgi:hypothetical protein
VSNFKRLLPIGMQTAEFSLLLWLLVFSGLPAWAGPFSDNFDTLIADLHSRQATLSNSTDKVQVKQVKVIQKLLNTLETKTSISLATDVKNFGSTGRALVKSFPDDFGVPGGPFQVDLGTALGGLANDVQAMIGTVQTNSFHLDIASPCASNVLTTLDIASNSVAAALTSADFATASKLLGSGLKWIVQAGDDVGKCISEHSGDFMKATISGAINSDFMSVGRTIYAEYDILGPLLSITSRSGGVVFNVTAMDVAGPGTYPLEEDGNHSFLFRSLKAVYGLSGEVTITTLDLANQKAAGTFSLTGTYYPPSGIAKNITITNGSFSVSGVSE